MSSEQTSSTPADMEQALQRMQEQLTQLRQTQSMMRRWTMVVVAVLTVESLAFGWGIYSTVKSNFFDSNKVMAEVKPRLSALVPTVQAQGLKMIQEVGPVYKDLAISRFQTAAPQFISNCEKELQDLASDLQTDARKSLEMSFNRVAQRLEPELKQSFPALTDSAALERLGKQFEGRVHEEFGKLALKLDGMYQVESAKVWNALVAVDADPDMLMQDKSELERTLLHHLVMLADHEIMHAGEPDSATEVIIDIVNPGDPHARPSK